MILTTPTQVIEKFGNKYELYQLPNDTTGVTTYHRSANIWGPGTITRVYYDDGSCNTTEHDYDPKATLLTFFPGLG